MIRTPGTGPRERRSLVRTPAGQAIVEFALTVPIFLFVVFGVIDGGRLILANNTVAQAAREAARLGAVQAAWIGKTGAACSAPTCPANTAVFRSNVLAAANQMTPVIGPLTSTNMHLTCTASGAAPTGSWTGGNNCSTSNAAGNVVSVRIVVQVAPVTPAFSLVFPQFTLSASTSMVISRGR